MGESSYTAFKGAGVERDELVVDDREGLCSLKFKKIVLFRGYVKLWVLRLTEM